MKKKILICMCILLTFILLFPIPQHLKDGGTIEYNAILYNIQKVHRFAIEDNKEYEQGTIIKILGFEVFNNVE